VQNTLYAKLRNNKIFKEPDVNSTQANRDLQKCVKDTYKKICASKKDEGEKETLDKGVSEKKNLPEKIHNLKVTRKSLITYLRKRYSARVATKMACIFDWSNTQESYEPFY